MDHIFQALSDSTRRSMLRDLADGPRSVTDLAAPYPMSLAAASRHIKVLEAVGLIRREVSWRTHICHLDAAPLAFAHQEIEFYQKFWWDRLDVLERLLTEDADHAATPVDSKVTPKRKEPT